MTRIDSGMMRSRLARIISARTPGGALPRIPVGIKPALEQIANAQISGVLFLPSLQLKDYKLLFACSLHVQRV